MVDPAPPVQDAGPRVRPTASARASRTQGAAVGGGGGGKGRGRGGGRRRGRRGLQAQAERHEEPQHIPQPQFEDDVEPEIEHVTQPAQPAEPEEVIEPYPGGPIDRSLLTKYDSHIARPI